MDLIVFFEMVKSPIRLVQRMGRTGRKRSGKVIILSTDDMDIDKMESSNTSASSICKALRDPLSHLRLHKQKNITMKSLNLPPSNGVQIILRKFEIEEFRMSQVASNTSSKNLKVCNYFNML